jgi:hypothetical protein
MNKYCFALKWISTLFLLCFCLSSGAYAATSKNSGWYTIEYLVFKNNATSLVASEPSHKEPLQLQDNARNLEALLTQKTFAAFASKKQLSGAKQRITTIPDYTLITQGGWAQKIQKDEALAPVIINKTTATDTLYGTLTLHRGRFLHVDVDLELSEMSATFSPVPSAFRLTETRRFRTSELHYFDHPNLGVLVKIEKLGLAQP